MSKKQPRAVARALPALVSTATTALVPSNPRVQLAAKRLNWKPETLVRRIQEALPAVVEQQVYLRVAPSFGIQPESIAKLLRYHLGSQELQPHDLNDRPAGNNLVNNKFTVAMEFLRETLNLVSHRSIYSQIGISMETAAQLVTAYGEDAPFIVESVVDSIGLIRERLGIRRLSDSRLISLVITFIAKRAADKTPVLDVMELFEIEDDFQVLFQQFLEAEYE